MKCLVCESVEVVYSGVDAFLLGIPTEKYCYKCANQGWAQAREAQDNGQDTLEKVDY